MKFLNEENYLLEESLNNCLIYGDCIKIMENIKLNNFVDLILVDLPYGISKNKWDNIIPLEQMWENFNKILKSNGVVVLTSTQPFTTMLINSNIKKFKYDMIWEKTISSGQLNVKKMPLRNHENILIFYQGKITYNEQLTIGKPYEIKRKINYNNRGYNEQKDNNKINNGFRHAKSVLKISNPRIKGGHPTQKPLELMDYFIKTFTNENELVFDCCCGSGTTLVSACKLNRNYLGIENNENYYDYSKERLINEFNNKTKK